MTDARPLGPPVRTAAYYALTGTLRRFLTDTSWIGIYDVEALLAEVAGVDPARVRVTVTAGALRLEIRADGEAWAAYAQGREQVEPDAQPVSDVVQWAYRTVLDSPTARRIEVGQRLLDALIATAPPDPDPDYAGPRTPHHTLLGLPLAVNDALDPMGWRLLDGSGHVVALGSGI